MRFWILSAASPPAASRLERRVARQLARPGTLLLRLREAFAAQLKPLLEEVDDFISIDRFQSLATPGKLPSLSFWRDEEAVKRWRNTEQHRFAQTLGRSRVLADYRLRVAEVVRDYGLESRKQAPADSRARHG